MDVFLYLHLTVGEKNPRQKRTRLGVVSLHFAVDEKQPGKSQPDREPTSANSQPSVHFSGSYPLLLVFLVRMECAQFPVL